MMSLWNFEEYLINFKTVVIVIIWLILELVTYIEWWFFFLTSIIFNDFDFCLIYNFDIGDGEIIMRILLGVCIVVIVLGETKTVNFHPREWIYPDEGYPKEKAIAGDNGDAGADKGPESNGENKNDQNPNGEKSTAAENKDA